MTIDKSLKGKGRLSRQRSVLSREERIIKMREEDRWPGERSPFGLPKYRVAKISTGKKKKAKEEGETAAAGADAKPADAAPAKKPAGDAKKGK